ncbi:hypothetical protein J7M00_09475 [bacterium]|nr:hypothetical protein [bacterium]
MKNLIIVVLLLSCFIASAQIIIDHNCTNLSQVPAEWIDYVRANVKFHYAHTSHGGQLTTGLSRIEASDTFYSYALDFRSLPDEDGAFCIFENDDKYYYYSIS